MGRYGILATLKNEAYSEDLGMTEVGVGGQNTFGWGDGVLCDNFFGQEVEFRIDTDYLDGDLLRQFGYDPTMWSNDIDIKNPTILELGIQVLPDEFY